MAGRSSVLSAHLPLRAGIPGDHQPTAGASGCRLAALCGPDRVERCVCRRLFTGLRAQARWRAYALIGVRCAVRARSSYLDGHGRILAGRARRTRKPSPAAAVGRNRGCGGGRYCVHDPARLRAYAQLRVISNGHPGDDGRSVTAAGAASRSCVDRRVGGSGVPGWLGCAAGSPWRHPAHHLPYDASSHRRGFG